MMLYYELIMGVTVYIVSSVETTGRHLENIHLNSYITLDTKVNSRWIKDLKGEGKKCKRETSM